MLINKSVFLIIHTVTNGTEKLKSKFHMLPCCMAPRLDFIDYKVSLAEFSCRGGHHMYIVCLSVS
jgi:hypothetical protein